MTTRILTHSAYVALLAAYKPAPVGALIVDADTGSFLGVVGTHGSADFVSVVVTSAQLLALNATPQTIIAAPGAGIAVVPWLTVIHKPAGTAYAGIAAGEDLVLKYTDGSGAQCSSVVETTGFLDQTTAQTRWVGMPASTGSTAGDVKPVANAVVVLHLLTGEIITGDSNLIVRSYFRRISTAFTA